LWVSVAEAWPSLRGEILRAGCAHSRPMRSLFVFQSIGHANVYDVYGLAARGAPLSASAGPSVLLGVIWPGCSLSGTPWSAFWAAWPPGNPVGFPPTAGHCRLSAFDPPIRSAGPRMSSRDPGRQTVTTGPILWRLRGRVLNGFLEKGLIGSFDSFSGSLTTPES